MIVQTKGIALHFIKYSESSVIAAFYTERFGRLSCMINASRRKKTMNKVNLLQPLYILDLEIYFKNTREIQKIKEIKPVCIFQSIPFQIEKSTQAIFLAEILFRVLQEEECSPNLFHFLESSIQYFDLMEKRSNNFLFYFLIRLTEHLGFYPNMENIQYQWFDLMSGSFISEEPYHSKYLSLHETEIFKKLLKLKIFEIQDFTMRKDERKQLLEKLVVYYQIHFEMLGEIKSLPVLQEVFR